MGINATIFNGWYVFVWQYIHDYYKVSNANLCIAGTQQPRLPVFDTRLTPASMDKLKLGISHICTHNEARNYYPTTYKPI